MTIFNYPHEDALGCVIAVDTATVTVRVDDIERLKSIQVNRLTVLRSSRPGQHLIGIVTRITRKADNQIGTEAAVDDPENTFPENNLVRVTLIGTLLDKDGVAKNVFRRTLETVPEIDAACFSLEGERLTAFMDVISKVPHDGPKLAIGRFTLDDAAAAYLNGNKLFQRHALVVGSTGSGKSWTTARLLEQMEPLPQANAIVFDIHGEYEPLQGDGFRHLRVAGPADIGKPAGMNEGVLYLPYWLLGYEALVSMFVDRSDQNAPNQSMQMMNCISDAKRNTLEKGKHEGILANFTIDSPIPFAIDDVIKELTRLDTEEVEGAKANTTKKGPYADKLSRLIGRLEAKRNDRRLGFLFQPPPASMDMPWLEEVANHLMAGRGSQADKKGGIKIINFSEVPSDILPLTVSVLANMIFTANQWTSRESRHPISLFCDEAHLYIPERASSNAGDAISVGIFERIAKEGRKYGVGLVVISQRPSEVNRTVLSQCNNVIAMRLTNGDDQSVIRRLLPDSLGGFGDLLPILDTGEALIVGDAILLPTRVRVDQPNKKPNSGTIDFWDEWNANGAKASTPKAIEAWRRQSLRSE
tara:strand:- start:275 stop:2029 length:1755 start_codon:yes stop_codon:yes gene_type:complete